MPTPSVYEQAALVSIARWKELTGGPLDMIAKRFSASLGGLSGWLLKGRVGDRVGQVFVATLGVLNEGASWTISRPFVFGRFNRVAGVRVDTSQDIFKLDLETVDHVVGRLEIGYVLAGALEGAATGLEGGLGLAADIPLILGLNLRLIADYATHYGFDANDPVERVYALSVLDFALASGVDARRAALAQLGQLSDALNRGLSASELGKLGGVSARQLLSNSIAQRLAKVKIGQLIPVAGAAIGGGFNGWFTYTTCDAAYHLYRGRFLAKRLGG